MYSYVSLPEGTLKHKPTKQSPVAGNLALVLGMGYVYRDVALPGRFCGNFNRTKNSQRVPGQMPTTKKSLSNLEATSLKHYMEAVVLTFPSKFAESVSTPFSLGSGGHQPVISSMACNHSPSSSMLFPATNFHETFEDVSPSLTTPEGRLSTHIPSGND